MLMICGMYQLFGNAFVTVDGTRFAGLGILDVTTHGNPRRMIGPVVATTDFGDLVGYGNHSGATTLGPGQAAFGTIRSGFGNNSEDRTEGAGLATSSAPISTGRSSGQPRFADGLLSYAVPLATGAAFVPEPSTTPSPTRPAPSGAPARRLGGCLGRGRRGRRRNSGRGSTDHASQPAAPSGTSHEVGEDRKEHDTGGRLGRIGAPRDERRGCAGLGHPTHRGSRRPRSADA